MLRSNSKRLASYSENVFRRAARKDHDPFLRDGLGPQKAIGQFRKQPRVVRYTFVFMIGFLVGGIVEVFACKTKLYESVMANKDSRRQQIDEFVVDYRKNVEKWQEVDMQRNAAATSASR